MDASGPFSPPPIIRRFVRSRFGQVAFAAFLAAALWGVCSQLFHTLSAPVVQSSDFNFIVIGTFVCWSMVTRRASFRTRWLAPLAGCLMCWVLADMAAKNLTLNLTRQEGTAAILYLAAFYCLIVLWIVLFPVEELDYQGGAALRGQLRFRPVGFALAGAAMVAVAGVRFSVHLRSLLNHGASDELVAARNVLVYLSIALFILAGERIFWPGDRSAASRILRAVSIVPDTDTGRDATNQPPRGTS